MYQPEIWAEFGTFLSDYRFNVNKINVANSFVETEYTHSLNNLKESLNSGAKASLENTLSTSSTFVLSEANEQYTYSSIYLGTITYSLNKKVFDEAAWNKIESDALEENFKYNSLLTGAMPYSSCYGASNYCDEFGCSKIKIIAGYSDVVVTIKNGSGNVVRHGYIANGDS